MRLHRLRVTNFSAIRDATIEFGQGLNVLYGPNDLGKSTLVDAIRLALLLPHGSTACEQYIPWTNSRDPLVELTFETEQQRIWRVTKEFGKRGSSLLQESKNGRDFEDVERARKVDARLREILRWGIPEPGGSGSAKGIPTSFLATALLSTQADVAALLREGLHNDPSATGKEQIAAALQAIAQDPLFVSLLTNVQARRDEAYTDKGSKKTAKGSVFKVAADRVREAREERDRLQRIVNESEGTEQNLRHLQQKRDKQQEALALVTDRVAGLRRLAEQALNRAAAAELVRCAELEVSRITRLRNEVEEAERQAKNLLNKEQDAAKLVAASRAEQAEADSLLKAMEDIARAEGSDPEVNNKLVRQQLELQQATAEQAATAAQQQLDKAAAAKKLIEAVIDAELQHSNEESRAQIAHEYLLQTLATERALEERLHHCEMLERALDLRLAKQQEQHATLEVDKLSVAQKRFEVLSMERSSLSEQRATITIPALEKVAFLRQLANELAAARGALLVGLVVTVTPTNRLDLRVQKDGKPAESISTDKPLEIVAAGDVQLGLDNIATVGIRGGRRDAQEKAASLEHRWMEEVVPLLAAANVTSLEALDTKIARAADLDSGIKEKDIELKSLKIQIDSLLDAGVALQRARDRVATCRSLLVNVAVETFDGELEGLVGDPNASLKTRRRELQLELDSGRLNTTKAQTDYTLARERADNLRHALDTALSSRDSMLASFPEGVQAALDDAGKDSIDATKQIQSVTTNLASLENAIAARKKRVEDEQSGARSRAEKAKLGVQLAQEQLSGALAARAQHDGRLSELMKQRDAEDLFAAETKLRVVKEQFAALPVPTQEVTESEVEAAKAVETNIKLELDALEREIQRTHGALEQVGGAVAREQLRDATEAFELAEVQEKELENDYEAWKLLLEQMKEADAAQASNLGQVLAPVIASRFQTLTQRRYDAVQLGSLLDTEGVVTAGALRPATRLSVGTREQLSTLYRLALAEYLQVTVVLDDQLVQSDGERMDWFRALLAEKSRLFQIIVFTCRPDDYLEPSAMIQNGKSVHTDTNNGFTRAIDLGRILGQRT